MKDDERKNAKIRSVICPQCGGPMEVNTQEAYVICKYCGSQIMMGKPKISAVESVLNFVKDQQKRIDDIKKEKKEEERKAREEADKAFNKYFWVYLLVIFISFGALLFMGDEEEKSSEISINHSSSQLVGKNYKDVVVKLQENGFTNVKTEAVEDLIIGLFATDGEVEQVEINGEIDFNSGTKFPKDAEIIVSYHTFPKTK